MTLGHYYREGSHAIAALATMLLVIARPVAGQSGPRIPITRNLVIGQTLRDGDAERESIVAIADASSRSVTYQWSFTEVHAGGDTIRDSVSRVVTRADLATAPRLREYYEFGESAESPGYTRYTISTSVFDQLKRAGSADYSILSTDRLGASRFGRARPVIVRWRGKLVRIGNTYGAFPILFNGQRVRVPAMHVRGEFTERGNQWKPDIWILGDRDHPLILKIAAEPTRVFQTVRIDLEPDVEKALTTLCRAEIPGIYFDFNSATLDPASDRTIASVAGILSRHPDWSVTIEGHTDSIGTARSNQLLSQRRAESVRDALVQRHRISSSRFKVAGYGSTKPRESNSTIEGRARNRRVEMQRPCGGSV